MLRASAALLLLSASAALAAPEPQPEVAVLAENGTTWETTIAISPADPNVAVAAGMHVPGTAPNLFAAYWTSDGGKSWRPSQPFPLKTATTEYRTPRPWAIQWWPSILGAIDDDAGAERRDRIRRRDAGRGAQQRPRPDPLLRR